MPSVAPAGARARGADAFSDLRDDPQTAALAVLDREPNVHGAGRVLVVACVMAAQGCFLGSLWEEALERPISYQLLCGPGVHFVASMVFIGLMQMELWQCGHLFLAVSSSRCKCTAFLFLLVPKLGLACAEMLMGLPFLWRAQGASELVLNLLLLTFVARLDDHVLNAGVFKPDPAIGSAFLDQVTKEKRSSRRYCNGFMTLLGCTLFIPSLVSLYNVCS
ncbi:unnamed protein product [Durusdinium trenchii]|uniref:Uncharacterized protein n=1 Tax=Durusdinium trenchii TaxID=1381693 RepID=A0ABP0KNC3_9DINO